MRLAWNLTCVPAKNLTAIFKGRTCLEQQVCTCRNLTVRFEGETHLEHHPRTCQSLTVMLEGETCLECYPRSCRTFTAMFQDFLAKAGCSPPMLVLDRQNFVCDSNVMWHGRCCCALGCNRIDRPIWSVSIYEEKKNSSKVQRYVSGRK